MLYILLCVHSLLETYAKSHNFAHCNIGYFRDFSKHQKWGKVFVSILDDVGKIHCPP